MKIIALVLIALSTALPCMAAKGGQVTSGEQAAITAEIAKYEFSPWWCLYGKNATVFHADGPHGWVNVTPDSFRAKVDKVAELDDRALACSFFALDSNCAWVCIDSGRISVYRTIDGGRHWHWVTFMGVTEDGCEYISFSNRLAGGMLVFSDAASHQMEKAIYRTTDGGRIWRLSSFTSMQPSMPSTKGCLPTINGPTGFTVRSATDFWIAADFGLGDSAPLFHSTDGGRTWRYVSLPGIPGGDKGQMLVMQIETPTFHGNRLLLGSLVVDERDGRTGRSVMYRTTDGGRHWRRSSSLR